MKVRRIYLALTASTLFISALLLILPMLYRPEERVEGLRIIVTFPSLLDDVAMLVCSGDNVSSIVPPGVDPHEYQLTPRDVERLRESHLIVSTGHAPFEARIAEFVARGELKAKLVDIPSITGLKLRVNPATGTVNLHWPIFDPSNYLLFIKNVSSILAELRPACASVYLEKARDVEVNVKALEAQAPSLNVTAAAASPVVQYAVEWMGMRVKYFLAREHELPVSPEDLARVEKALSEREVDVVVSIQGAEDTPLGAKLEEFAKRYNVPLIRVPSHVEPRSTVAKMVEIVQEGRKLAEQLNVTREGG